MVYGRLICLFILFQSFTAFAQTEIKGILIDSARQTFLETATISVYEKGDSKVSKVALSDRFELTAVEILAPVRMNGDTIEFNADAFALDTNAVIEIRSHKLPGMVDRRDGVITYN